MKALQLTNENNAAARLDAKRQAKRDRRARPARTSAPSSPEVHFEGTAIDRAQALIKRLKPQTTQPLPTIKAIPCP